VNHRFVQVFLLVSFMSAFAGCTKATVTPQEPSFEIVSGLLYRLLPEQTGTTEGYCHEFTIHLHEPARSLIAIGPECIPELIKHIDDMRPTQAYWYGRSSMYNLRVSDVVVCILRKIGGESELEILRERLNMYKEVMEHVDQFTNYHETFRGKLRWYSELMRPARSGRAIIMWAIREIEERMNDKATRDFEGKPRA